MITNVWRDEEADPLADVVLRSPKKSKKRTKSTGEVFTPPALVDEIVNKLYESSPELFTDKSKTFLDPACGDGEFLRGVIRKLKKVVKHKFTKRRWEHAIQYQLLGVDLMWDNTCDTIYYLLRSFNDVEPQPTVIPYPPHERIPTTATPDEINALFEGRAYTDDAGIVLMRRVSKEDNHHIEYSYDGENWTKVENIVRANSLTEWDFKEWRSKLPPTSNLLTF